MKNLLYSLVPDIYRIGVVSQSKSKLLENNTSRLEKLLKQCSTMPPIISIIFSLLLVPGCISQVDIFKQYFPQLINSGDNVVLYFMGNVFPSVGHNKGYFIQQILQSDNYANTTHYLFNRHSNPVSVIVASSNFSVNEDNNNQYLWGNVYMKTDTVVILIHQNTQFITNEKICLSEALCENLQNDILTSPSIKLVFYFSNITVLACPLLCSTSIKEDSFSNLQINTKKQVRKIHKMLFWNAHNEVVHAQIAFTSNHLYEESRNKVFSCDSIYKTHNFSLMPKVRYCWAKQMLASELSKIHNLTYQWTKTIYGKRFIANDIRDKKYNFSLSWYEGMHLQYYSGWNYHYCVDSNIRNKTSELAYDTFIKPLSISCWIGFIVVWLNVTLYYTLQCELNNVVLQVCYKFIQQLTEAFYLLSCSGVKLQHKGALVVLLTFSSYLFWELYQNEITGLTITDEKVLPYQTMDEFLK